MTSWTRCLAPAIVIVTPISGYATQYLSVEEAQHVCFPAATQFEASHIIFTPDQIQQIETQSGQKVATRGQQIWKVKAGATLAGYFLVDYVIGKHLIIDYAIALNPDASVKQVELLQYRESYGSEIKSPNWLHQFEGKTYQSPLSLNQDILNIGGATLSSRHVTEGIKRVLVTFHVAAQ